MKKPEEIEDKIKERRKSIKDKKEKSPEEKPSIKVHTIIQHTNFAYILK